MLREDINEMEIQIPARLGDVVEESLNGVKKLHRRRMEKRLGAACGSLAAVAGAFLIFGFANPALASEIPLLGKLFQNVSTKTGHISGSLEGYGLVQAVGKQAETDNAEWELLASEAYSDGDTVQVGLEFSAAPELRERFRYLSVNLTEAGKGEWIQPCEAFVNGEKARVRTVSNLTLQGDRFVGAMVLEVPEGLREEKSLEVSAVLRELAAYGEKGAGKEEIPGEFRFQFPVAVDRVHEISFTSQAEENGARVLAVKSTPARTVITVEKPYWGDVYENAPEDGSLGYPVLYTADGAEIAMDHGTTYDGGYRYDSKEPQTADLYFDGVPAGTKQVVLKFCNDNRRLDRKKLAEFTIDLERQTITPAGTVVDQDWGTPYGDGAVIGKFGEGQEQNGYTVTCVVFQYARGTYVASVLLKSKNGRVGEPERLRLEVADETGRVIFQSDSVTGQEPPKDAKDWNWTLQYTGCDADDETAWETLAPTGYGVWADLTEENGWVMEGDTVTVTIYDLDTGETLCADTRTLERLE